MKKLRISGQFPLRTIRGSDGKPRSINIYTELMNLLSLPSDPRAGVNYLEVAKRSKVLTIILDAHDAGKEEVSLETADYDLICDCIKTYGFSLADPAIDNWLKSILDAPEENTSKPKLKAAN